MTNPVEHTLRTCVECGWTYSIHAHYGHPALCAGCLHVVQAVAAAKAAGAALRAQWGRKVTADNIGDRGYFAGLSVVIEDYDSKSFPYPVAQVRYVVTDKTEWIPAGNVSLA